MSYYHDEKMQKIFRVLTQPKSLEEMDISTNFLKNSIIKIISSYGTIKVGNIHKITGLSVEILEDCIKMLEKEDMCAPVSGGFLFASVEYTVTQLGHEKAKKLMEENSYTGMVPVAYDIYTKIMDIQIKDRFPIEIPKEVIEKDLKG